MHEAIVALYRKQEKQNYQNYLFKII